MATTNAVILAGLVGVSASAFADVAPRPAQETQLTAQASQPACTVRLNRYTDNAPIDERYINTKYADSLRSSNSFSGITYVQQGTLEQKNDAFRIMDRTPATIDASFRSNDDIDGLIMADKHYHYSIKPSGYTVGTIIPAQYMNWTQSFETDLNDPKACLNIRHSIVSWPPDYTSLGSILSGKATHTSDSFAESVWKNTGLPSDSASLLQNPAVRAIDRETRLNQDHISGQLKDDYSAMPPPFKP